jgi:integrase
MASIHKTGRYWHAYYTLADGRRAHRSTGQTDRKKALDIARTLERATLKARAGELTEATARKLLNDVLESVGESPLRQETVREFFVSWLQDKQGSTKPAVHRLYAGVSGHFLEFLGPRADKTLTGITPRDISAWRNKRLTSDGVSSGTLLIELKIIKGTFASARRQGLLVSSPADATQLPLNKPLEREVFTPEEIGALLAVAPQEWQTLIYLGYYLGARLSDAKALRWSCVDLTAGELRYTQNKTGRAVIVPIHADLHAHLLTIAGNDNPLAYLCPTLAKRRNDGRQGLSAEFVRLMRVAGVDAHTVQAPRRSFSRKSFHALRHSFSSALANAGVPAELRMKLVGHTSAQTHTRYTHLEWAPLQQAIAMLPGVLYPQSALRA